MPSLIPSPYPVAHVRRVVSDEIDPDTGNPRILDVDSQPVVRYIQSLSQIGRLRGSSKNLFNPEVLKAIQTDLHMSVENPEVYGPGDQVRLQIDLDQNGDYVDGSGFSFVVDGLPNNATLSPWPSFTRAFGGLVRIRRVS